MSIRLAEIPSAADPNYAFAAQLYMDAFPPEERRNPLEWFALHEQQPQMHVCVALSCERGKEVPVGLACFWQFESFVYVEHLAVATNLRQKGYGGEILQQLMEEKPVVLEVEPPVDEITQLRVAFYRKHGLDLCGKPYVQPPYKADLPPVELCLMTNRTTWLEAQFHEVKSKLYTKVYGVEADAVFVV